MKQIDKDKLKDIREKAEKILQSQSLDNKEYTNEEISIVLHELQVHQIELELQNDELSRIRYELEASRNKYYSLFDLAPVGYLTLDMDLKILDANETAAKYLAVPKAALFGLDLSTFVQPESQDDFYFHFKQDILSMKQVSKEINLCNKNGKTINILSVSMLSESMSSSPIIKTSLTDISDKRKTQDLLKFEKDRAELIFQTVPVGIYTIEINRNITSWNKRAEEITGYTPEEVIGHRCTLCSFDDEACNFWHEMISAPSRNTLRIINDKYGNTKYLNVNIDLIKDPAGNISGCIYSFDDITEQKENERTLTLLKTAIDASADNIFITDPKTYKFIEVNESASRDLGYSREELLNMMVSDINKTITEDELVRILSNPKLFEKEAKTVRSVHTRKDGSTFPVEVLLRGFYSDDSPLFVAIVRNISNRAAYEDKILAQQQFLNSIVENLPVGVFAKDIKNDYAFSLWNAKMEELFGMPRENVIGKTDYDIMPTKAEADFFREFDKNVIKSGKVVESPKEFVSTPRGTLIGHTVKIGLYDENGEPHTLLGIFEDITEATKQEELLKISEERYRSLFNSVPIGIYRANSEQEILIANEPLIDMLSSILSMN